MTTGPRLEEFRKELRELLRARFPVVQIATMEEDRAIREVETCVSSLGGKIMCWSASRGVHTLHAPPKRSLNQADLAVALELFEAEARQKQNHAFILIDPYAYLSDRSANPIYRRRLRDFAIDIRTKGYHCNCIIISPSTNIPLELEKEISILDFPLPERPEVRALFEKFLGRFNGAQVVEVENDPHLLESLVDASLGLTLQEIENAMSRAIIDDLKIDRNDVVKIFRQKQFVVRKNSILEYYDTRDLSVDMIGGLGALKNWLETRVAAFSDAGQRYGIAPPKGVLLTGVPGCGKSLSAKCVAAAWRLPLIRLDLGKVYSRWIGSSEEHIRSAIATCESVAPCVLWIDEIEKGLPRTEGPVGDSGVSLRVLGSFLTWLQEKTAPVFVFATANQINLLPPEILRKGRFDEVFFVDLPTAEERRDIISIQIKKTRRDPDAFDLDELVRLSGEETFGEGGVLSGAEIEAWINESLIHAFYHDKHRDSRESADLSMDDLRVIVRRIVPLARLRHGEIAAMRAWADTHALSASRVAGAAVAPTGGVTIGGRRLDF